jgi:Uma2 family endonuclease
MPAERLYVPIMASPSTLMTADELLHAQIPDKHVELVRGVLIVREPPGLRHGRIAIELGSRLAGYARGASLGRVYVESGFHLARNPDTVRGPDIAFISAGRIPDPEPAGYAALAPDLVVEILSPGDRPGEVLAKVADWLSAGTLLVWVVDADRRVARVYRADGTESVLTAHEALLGEDVLSGFSCPLEAAL